MKFITVDSDRYGGVYSDALFTAWKGDKPFDVDASDNYCAEFWDNNYRLCGKGSTSLEAVKDFFAKSQQDKTIYVWIGWFDIIDFDFLPNEERFLIIGTKAFFEWWPESEIDFKGGLNHDLNPHST